MFAFILLLLCFHELAHIISAKFLNLKIYHIGFNLKPLPHFFVGVENTNIAYKKNIYLFSGFFCTIVLFVISISNGFWRIEQLYWAFLIQLAIETNPFYSDFVIYIINKKVEKSNVSTNHSAILRLHYFSLTWYLHFISWTAFIMFLFNLKFI